MGDHWMTLKRHIAGASLLILLMAGLLVLPACGREKNAADKTGAAERVPETSAADESEVTERFGDETPAGGGGQTAPAPEDAEENAGDAAQMAADSEREPQAENALKPVAAEPEDDDLVRVRDYIPDILVDLKYATEDNFTGQIIYDFKDAYLRYGTVKRLQYVEDVMKEQGLTLKIWDAFRPLWAQQALWDAYPDTTYVSNPEERGYTSHNFGNTVDITVVREDGTEIPMPTGFDDFSLRADRDYDDCTEEEAENAWMLDQTMSDAGFEGYWGEWWHYQDIDEYPGEDLEGAVLQ